MSERDWRIFREDFNISFRGNTDILPIRNWDEGGIPKEIREVWGNVGNCGGGGEGRHSHSTRFLLLGRPGRVECRPSSCGPAPPPEGPPLSPPAIRNYFPAPVLRASAFNLHSDGLRWGRRS